MSILYSLTERGPFLVLNKNQAYFKKNLCPELYSLYWAMFSFAWGLSQFKERPAFTLLSLLIEQSMCNQRGKLSHVNILLK